jgi:phosphatidylserine synthase
LDRQEVRRSKFRKPRLAKPKATLGPRWRRAVPYLFMGTIFAIAFIALHFILNAKLILAGKWVLTAIVVAGFEYQFRRFSIGPTSMEDELSTLSDIFCFALVPGFLIYQLAFRGWGVLGLIGLFAIIFGAVIRLSFYKLYNPRNLTREFIGIPVTLNAGFIALMAVLSQVEMVSQEFRLLVLVLIIGLTLLTVSTIPYPNPAEWPWVFILATLNVIVIWIKPPIGYWAAWLLMLGGAVYIVMAPMAAQKGGKGHGGID